LNKYELIYDYITDANSFSIAEKMLIPMGGALLLAYIYHKGLRKYKTATLVITSLAILLSLLVAISQYIEYRQIVEKIEQGETQIEQGQISKYQPIDITNHGSLESFSINGIKFAYSDYHRIPGYHHACKNGGVICKEGQEIRLSYYTKNNINYIVRLEVLKN
jgi:hypothetical protein